MLRLFSEDGGTGSSNLSFLGKKFRTEIDDIISWAITEQIGMGKTVGTYEFL